MTDKRDRPPMTRELGGYQNRMMGDYEKRAVTTAHLTRPMPEPKPKPAEPQPTPTSAQATSTSSDKTSS